MKRRVYRSLDRPAAFFGIRGRFMWVMAPGLVGAVAAYLLTLSLQSRIDEKDIWKRIVRKGYPSLYKVRPKHVRNIWRGFNLPRSTTGGV